MRRRDHVTVPGQPGRMVTPEQLEAELAQRREVEQVTRDDELARKDAQASHRIDLSGVDEREAEAVADAGIAREYRHARSAGARIRLRSDMARSGEVRALRLDRLRALNLKVLVPVLVGFAAWSTTGVHDGAARLMAVDKSAATWWALWILEPVLIGAVVWITIVRARLASSGGRIVQQALYLLAGFLTTSIALNLAAPTHAADSWHKAAAMLAHAIGPVGAAVTAHLIGVVEDSVSAADPWHEGQDEDKRPVPLLADMDLSFAMTTRAERDADKLTDEIADTPFVAAIAEWLARREPPEEGLTLDPPTPGGTSPNGAARALPNPSGAQPMRAAHIDPGQGERPDSEGAHIGGSHWAARRASGEQTRARIAAHMDEHPDHTITQTADALDLSTATVKRHRAALRQEGQ